MTTGQEPAGPLAGVRFVEFDGLGPVPFAGMMLSDLGADGIRVTRPSGEEPPVIGDREVYHRGRDTTELDLKSDDGRAAALDLVSTADVLIEGYRPGVMERLGLDPTACHAVQPDLVYGRMTGFGQTGPWQGRAGHDINYLAVTGALDAFRRVNQAPVPPLNLVADFGGGALYLVTGLLAGLLRSRATGEGQIVDASMTDGVAHLLASVCGRLADGSWSDVPGTNLLDTGAPFYDVYETADGRYLAVGALEEKYYERMLDVMELTSGELPDRWDRARWPELRAIFADRVRSRRWADWQVAFAGVDACVTPVLTLREAHAVQHLRERGTYIERDGVVQPGRAPRVSPAESADGYAWPRVRR